MSFPSRTNGHVDLIDMGPSFDLPLNLGLPPEQNASSGVWRLLSGQPAEASEDHAGMLIWIRNRARDTDDCLFRLHERRLEIRSQQAPEAEWVDLEGVSDIQSRYKQLKDSVEAVYKDPTTVARSATLTSVQDKRHFIQSLQSRTATLFSSYYEWNVELHRGGQRELKLVYTEPATGYARLSLLDQGAFDSFCNRLKRFGYIDPDLYLRLAGGMYRFLAKGSPYHPLRSHAHSLEKNSGERREELLTEGDGGEGSHEAHVTSRQLRRYQA